MWNTIVLVPDHCLCCMKEELVVPHYVFLFVFLNTVKFHFVLYNVCTGIFRGKVPSLFLTTQMRKDWLIQKGRH